MTEKKPRCPYLAAVKAAFAEKTSERRAVAIGTHRPALDDKGAALYQHACSGGTHVQGFFTPPDPLTPDLFPGMSGRQITGIYATYQLAEHGAARFLLGGVTGGWR